MATRRGSGKGEQGARGGRAGAAAAATAHRGPRTAVSHDGDTERRILEAARRVFIRSGSAGARMQEIAEEAGVNQALLHYYFRTKDQLGYAVFREAAGKLFPGIVRILGSDLPLEQRVEQVVHHYIDTLRAHPFLPGYVLAELNFHPERITAFAGEQLQRAGASDGTPALMLAKLQEELDRRAAAGEIRAIAPDQFLVNLASMCVFPFAARPMLSALLGFQADSWDRFLDVRRVELPRFILNALRP